MPDPQPSTDLTETANIPKPEDTKSITAGPLTQSSAPIDAARGTGADTLFGRMIVEQGLATDDEVSAALRAAKAGSNAGKPLPQIMVDSGVITAGQLARLKTQVEAERSGQRIPGYKILGKLGSGAMATVFKARQLNLDRLVAIKVLPRKFTSNIQFIDRFYAEGRAAAQLNHPNIVQAYDVGKAGEYHYFVMEFVDGRTVFDDIVAKRRYEEKEAIEIVLQVASALEHAHERGLIHRDVKPKNIMITKSGVVKLADMGLARAMTDKEAAEAEAGKAFGTPYYISPEQIRGERDIGPPADVYSLGATLYHMLTGSVPFDGDNPSAVMHKHLKQAITPPDQLNAKLSAGICEVMEMMLAKAPKKRYQSTRDLMLDLRAIQAGKPPIIAHRGVQLGDLAQLAQAEAAAVPADALPLASASTGLPSWVVPTLAGMGLTIAGLLVAVLVLAGS